MIQNNISLREMLLESMKKRLRSNVRLGFAVSGGIDSAVLVGIVRHLLGKDAELDLFSVASNNLAGNESDWQKMVVAKNGGNHHNIWVETFDADLLPTMISHTHRAPVAWNNLAHFALCKRVRQTGVTVLFNGQGADELFGGYPDYFIQTLFSERKQLGKFQKKWPIEYKEALRFFLKRKLRNALSDSQKFKIEKSVWGNKLTESMLQDPILSLHPKISGVEEMMLGDYYGSLQGTQFYGKLHQMLAWEDRNGMAFQLESRNPFADDLHIPQKYLGNFKLHELMEGGLTKGILRNAFQDLLPTELFARTDKKGFSVPETWLTQKHGQAWKDAIMYEGLDVFIKRDYRNKLLQNFTVLNHKDLQHYFRIASLGYFKLALDNERK
jgi:asparagine synthase (glutamine-hydrolysing)